MNTCIALLRGINVSGKNLIKMEALRASLEAIGFKNVRSYVQSGNLLFESPEQDMHLLERQITDRIQSDFACTVPVLVLSSKAFVDILAANPFAGHPEKDTAYMHITFLAQTPQLFADDALQAKAAAGEVFHCSPRAVYLYCPGGYGNTRLNNNLIENKLKVSASTRNWKTCLALKAMLQE